METLTKKILYFFNGFGMDFVHYLQNIHSILIYFPLNVG